MSDPVFSDVHARLKTELRRQQEINPNGSLVTLLQDTLAYIDVPDGTPDVAEGENDTRRLLAHIRLHPYRALGWHTRRLGIYHPRAVTVTRTLIEAGTIQQKTVKVLILKETP
ncbi:hypothetical protein DM785_02455 [Deinococcus actinosclerus]|nr:hypothetical protein DM785_02455 [Deinococcus actinosclerus]